MTFIWGRAKRQCYAMDDPLPEGWARRLEDAKLFEDGDAPRRVVTYGMAHVVVGGRTRTSADIYIYINKRIGGRHTRRHRSVDAAPTDWWPLRDPRTHPPSPPPLLGPRTARPRTPSTRHNLPLCPPPPRVMRAPPAAARHAARSPRPPVGAAAGRSLHASPRRRLGERRGGGDDGDDHYARLGVGHDASPAQIKKYVSPPTRGTDG